MKTLIFTDERKDSLGKYAIIAEIEFTKIYEIVGCDIPHIFPDSATIKLIRGLYKNIDFTGIKLIEVEVIDKEKLDQSIKQVSDQYPYKQIGNRDSYSEYNEGWTDACDILWGKIKNLTCIG